MGQPRVYAPPSPTPWSAPLRVADTSARRRRAALALTLAVFAAAAAARLWNALAPAPGWGYDAWGHVAYVLYLDLFHALPHADQGWSYFHPPLHYLLAWPLCRAGDADALLRGMSLLASAASLGCAALAFRLARRAAPGQGDLALVAFAALAFLPVQLVVGSMVGNEATAAFCVSLAIAHFAAAGAAATWRRDLVTGALLGVALLAKSSAWVAAAAVLATLATWSWRRAPARAAVIAVGLAVVAGPVLIRNVVDQGTLVPTSSADPFVHAAESGQPPGIRTWRHYARVSPRLFTDASPLAPHQLGSVWGSLYANAWVDSFRESDRDRAMWLSAGTPRGVTAMLVLGLLPTGLALVGGALALRDVARGARRDVYVPLLWLALGMLAAEAAFAWRMPTWAALKASYLLPASLSFALFLARGVEAVPKPAARRALLAALGVVAGTAVFQTLEGVGLPDRGESPTAGAARFYFGDYAGAERVYTALTARSRWSVPWLDNRAAVKLAEGDAAGARELYRQAVAQESAAGAGAGGPGRLLALERRAQLAVAALLANDGAAAQAQLDDVLSQSDLPEARANLGALKAMSRDWTAAERALRKALAQDAELWPAWENLAFLLRRVDRREDADAAYAEALRHACRAPRGEVRGIGSGENIEWGVGRRWRLLLAPAGDAVELVTLDQERAACRRLKEHM